MAENLLLTFKLNKKFINWSASVKFGQKKASHDEKLCLSKKKKIVDRSCYTQATLRKTQKT